MGGLVAAAVFKKGKDNIASKYTSLNDIFVSPLIPGLEMGGKTADGPKKIGEWVEGKKCYIMVNVATK